MTTDIQLTVPQEALLVQLTGRFQDIHDLGARRQPAVNLVRAGLAEAVAPRTYDGYYRIRVTDAGKRVARMLRRT